MQMENQKNVTRWYTINIYVDQLTGEIITETEAKKMYQIVKKLKNVTYEHKIDGSTHRRENTGIIRYTNECRRKPEQLEIW